MCRQMDLYIERLPSHGQFSIKQASKAWAKRHQSKPPSVLTGTDSKVCIVKGDRPPGFERHGQAAHGDLHEFIGSLKNRHRVPVRLVINHVGIRVPLNKWAVDKQHQHDGIVPTWRQRAFVQRWLQVLDSSADHSEPTDIANLHNWLTVRC